MLQFAQAGSLRTYERARGVHTQKDTPRAHTRVVHTQARIHTLRTHTRTHTKIYPHSFTMHAFGGSGRDMTPALRGDGGQKSLVWVEEGVSSRCHVRNSVVAG